MLPPLVVAGTCLAGLSAILFLAAISTMEWATTEVMGRPIDVGLWKFSVDSTLFSYDHVPGSLEAVRALVIIGLLGAVAGGCLGVLVILFQHFRESSIKFHLFAFLTLGVTKLLAVVGCLVFKYQAYTDISEKSGFVLPDGTLGYSFFLAIIASIAGWAGGALMFYGGRRMTRQGYSLMH